MAALLTRRDTVRQVRAALAVAGLLVAGTARADDGLVGEVVATHGRFADAGRLIVTDVVLRTGSGHDVVVTQLGGRAGGLGQRMIPSPAPLVEGDRVRVQVRDGLVTGVGPDPTVSSFVRTGPTRANRFVFWRSGCVFITYDAAGTVDLPGDQEHEVLDRALGAWNTATDACSYITLVADGKLASTGPPPIGNDGINRVVFRDDEWCRPATGDMRKICLPNGAAGLTTITYIDDPDSWRDGELVDADVEINGAEFAISAGGQTLGTGACLADLANTFTHELGHVLGLDHTCLGADDPPKLDGDGDPVPLCSQTSDPAITEATMYISSVCGETKKATVEPDDVAGICAIYPSARDPQTCEPVPQQAGCCAAGGAGGGPAALALVTWAAASRRRRRSG
jgi:hypothetical protein